MWEYSPLCSHGHSWPCLPPFLLVLFQVLCIFINNSWRLNHLDFKYITLPLEVSVSKICIKLMGLRVKIHKCVEFHSAPLFLSLPPPPPFWGHYSSQSLASYITHDYTWSLPLAYQTTSLATAVNLLYFCCCFCFRK